MIFQLQSLNRITFHFLPEECQSCGWWQGHAGGWRSKQDRDEWSKRAEELFGGWGKLAMADQQLLGLIQYGPPSLFPGMTGLGCGDASPDSILIACNRVLDESFAATRRSLMLAALAELTELGVESVETFCYREPAPPEDSHLFTADFLQELGFYSARSNGGVQLMRIELGGAERSMGREQRGRGMLGLLDRIKHPAPSPSPVTPCLSRVCERMTVPGACV